MGLIILTLLGLKYLPGWVKLVWLFQLGAISESLDNNQRIALDSFGCFDLKTVKERTVTPPPPHNIPVVVPTHQVVRFRPYKYILLYHIKY